MLENENVRLLFQLGGIVTPNDGLCHLDAEGRYNESLNQVSRII